MGSLPSVADPSLHNGLHSVFALYWVGQNVISDFLANPIFFLPAWWKCQRSLYLTAKLSCSSTHVPSIMTLPSQVPKPTLMPHTVYLARAITCTLMMPGTVRACVRACVCVCVCVCVRCSVVSDSALCLHPVNLGSRPTHSQTSLTLMSDLQLHILEASPPSLVKPFL